MTGNQAGKEKQSAFMRIPLAQPEISDTDREAVLGVLRTPHLSFGPKLPEFESAAAAYVGQKFGVAVNSGTSALHLAFRLLDLPPGSEVILPSFAFVAPLNVLLQEKLQPVFVDIDATTLNVTPEAIAAAITPRTRAIVAIHTFGHPLAIDQLRALVEQHKLALIEDVCEALGAEIAGRKAGAWGDLSVLAFYPNKQITAGEGGMLLTSNTGWAERARRLRNQGRDLSLDWHQHTEAGYSYRLSEMNCALGRAQLERIEEIVQRRQAVAEIYDHKLSGLKEIVRPPLHVPNGRISWFCYVIQLSDPLSEKDRDGLCARLIKKGIGASRYFAPLHQQPVLAGETHLRKSFPVTEHVASRVLALPFFSQITQAQIQEVCDLLAISLEELRRKT
jgi:perosamine synthetase